MENPLSKSEDKIKGNQKRYHLMTKPKSKKKMIINR